MPPVKRDDPYPAYNFQIEVNGISDGKTAGGAFSEISGLEVAIHPIEFRLGTDDLTRKLPGLKSATNIVCKRGTTGDADFFVWIKSGLAGNVKRAEGAIILKDENQNPVMRWTFKRGWPCKYSGPSFKASGNEVAMETVEICIEELLLDA
jgi:phage tail-like protein